MQQPEEWESSCVSSIYHFESVGVHVCDEVYIYAYIRCKVWEKWREEGVKCHWALRFTFVNAEHMHPNCRGGLHIMRVHQVGMVAGIHTVQTTPSHKHTFMALNSMYVCMYVCMYVQYTCTYIEM